RTRAFRVEPSTRFSRRGGGPVLPPSHGEGREREVGRPVGAARAAFRGASQCASPSCGFVLRRRQYETQGNAAAEDRAGGARARCGTAPGGGRKVRPAPHRQAESGEPSRVALPLDGWCTGPLSPAL